MAFFPCSWVFAVTDNRPSSFISILTSNSFVIFWIVSQPFPMTSLILSTGILMLTMNGANGESSGRCVVRVFVISTLIDSRANWDWEMTFLITSIESHLILQSIWRAVNHLIVPATLKSISHRKSSCAWISVNISYFPFSSSNIIHIATQLTMFLIGTQASIIDIEEPHIEAIELEPLQVVISETILMKYGNSSSDGRTGSRAFSASLPCPISLLPGHLIILTSPTEKGGKL